MKKKRIAIFAVMAALCANVAQAALRDTLNAPKGYSFYTWGNSRWCTSGSVAQSANPGHNGSTYMETIVHGPAAITFNWSVSSESGWDCLHFYDNNSDVWKISGSVSESKVYYVGSGAHVIRFAYTKDGSVDSGNNRGQVWNFGVVKFNAPLVPSGYTQYYYIYTDGSSYINTGYTHSSDTRINGDFYLYSARPSGSLATTGWNALFGARNGSFHNNAFVLFARDNSGNMAWNRSGEERRNGTYPTEQSTVSCQGTVADLAWGSENYKRTTTSGTANSGTCPIFICDVNTSTSSGGTRCDNSRIKVDVNGFNIQNGSGSTCYRNFIPCKNSSGVIGLYDTVYGGFYSSSTSTGFSAYGLVSTLSLDLQGGNMGGYTVPYVSAYNGDSMPRVPAPIRTGYTFQGFYSSTGGGGTKYYNADGTSAKNWDSSNATATLYAYWIENTATLTYNANGRGTAPAAVTMKYTAACNAAAAITGVTGYTFSKWNTKADGSGTSYTAGEQVKGANEDPTAMTLYAIWTVNAYMVTLDAQGGKGGTESATATYDAAMPEATMPTKAGHDFLGYFDATEGGTKYYNADGTSAKAWDKTEATTLYAQWAAKNHMVTLDLAGGTGVGSTTVTYGEIPAKITAPTKTGAKFFGFFTEPDGQGTMVFDENGIAREPWMVDGDATLHAYWINELDASDSLEIAFDNRAVKPAKMGKAEVLTSSPSVWTDDDGTAQILAVIGEGTPVVVVDEVTADSSLWTPSELGLYTLTHTLAGNVKETAKFLVEGFNYAVTFDANGGTGEMSGTTLEYDAEGTAPECAYTREGYVFEAWNTKADGTGEKILPNGTYRNLVAKEGDVGVLYAQWAVDTETAVEYSVDVMPDSDPSTPAPKPIKVPSGWITENLPGVDPKEPEKVKEAMDTPDPQTGLKPWQKYVLGVGKNEKEAQVWTSSPQIAEKDKIKIVGKEYKPTKNTGFSVKYRLDTELKGQAKVKGALAASPEFDLDVSQEDPTGLYTVNVVFVPDGDEAGAETVESMNTVGILKVPSPKTLEIVAVPWEELAPSNGAPITVANLVKKATLTDGDKLHVYDRTAKNYKSYLYHAAEQTWEALGIYKVTAAGLEKIGGAPENAEQVARGSAVWLERKDVSKPFYLYGQYNSNAVETKIEKNRHNLVACPKMEPFHLNGKDANGANKISGTINANDQIMIPGVNDNPPKLYSYKSGKGWGYNTIPAGSRRLTFVTTDDEVPAGTGFWYISKGGTPTIKW